MINFRMFCSVMSQLFSLKTTAEFVFVKGCSRVLKQRAKHPIKVHIWGGISARGATQFVIFSGIMNAERLGAVYVAGLLTFIENGSLTTTDCIRIITPNTPQNTLNFFGK